MNTENTMSNKECKSELGKLYQAKQKEAPLQKIVFEIYSLFKFWIEIGDMLPINVSAKEYQDFTTTEVRWILNEFEKRGCVVEYEYDSITGKQFILTDLV